ncbi:hypothetical protein [Streptomyces sp. SLBN-8D4]|uniref:hypothetical protein n=1 Tax=Streptomyces sp. SLBN-8D4 TaxID=3377728 RepID=UPI003C79D7E0
MGPDGGNDQIAHPVHRGPGRTNIEGVAGKYAAGDTDPGPFGYVHRVDTGVFTLPPAVRDSAAAPADAASPHGVNHATLWTVRHG